MSHDLLNALFSFADSGDQEHIVDLSESFLSVCISYHLEGLGVSVFLEG